MKFWNPLSYLHIPLKIKRLSSIYAIVIMGITKRGGIFFSKDIHGEWYRSLLAIGSRPSRVR